MKILDGLSVAVVAGLAVALTALSTPAIAQQTAAVAVKVGADDIGGVVTSPHGPEAGVWVIAETTELPTKFARIVVTDDQGRYSCPICPRRITASGCAAMASSIRPRFRACPGKHLDLTAVPAPRRRGGAVLSGDLLVFDAEDPGTRASSGARATFPKNVTQQEWITDIKNRLHRLPSARPARDAHHSRRVRQHQVGEDAWMRRVQSGQAAPLMVNPLAGDLGGVPFKYFADWTDRVAKGELPHAKPPRPQGVERNVVITEWEWGSETPISTTSSRPTSAIRRSMPMVRSTARPSIRTDDLPILDPKTNNATFFHAPVRDPDMPESLGPGHAAMEKPIAPSAYWGDRRSGTTGSTTTTRCSTKRAGCG